MPELAFRAELKTRLQRYIAANRPELVIRADVGHTTSSINGRASRPGIGSQYGFDLAYP